MTTLSLLYSFIVDVTATVREIANAVAFARTHPTNLQDMD